MGDMSAGLPDIKLNKLGNLLTEKEKSHLSGITELSFPDFVNVLEGRNSIGDILVVLRRSLDMSLREFASLVGVSHAYIDKLERIQSDPTLKTVCIMADNLC